MNHLGMRLGAPPVLVFSKTLYQSTNLGGGCVGPANLGLGR